jgi:hypothetical protein
VRDGETGEATFDAEGKYRYLLSRRWNSNLPRIGFIMLNPSSADGERDDPTLRRCCGFARRWGYGAVDVTNLFALRSPHPPALRNQDDAVGPKNDDYLRKVAEEVDMLVVAWGNGGALRGRATQVRTLIGGRPAFCLGVTAQGEPRHPLYVQSATTLSPLPTAP